jgi:hypothetical protein
MPCDPRRTRWSANLVACSTVLALAVSACTDNEPTAPPSSQREATQNHEAAQVQDGVIVPVQSATGKILTATPTAGAVAPDIGTHPPLGTQFPPEVMKRLKQPTPSLPMPSVLRGGIFDNVSPLEAPSAPSLSQSFLGFSRSQGGNGSPPDNGLAVGPNHVVGAVNFTLKIWNKTGGQLAKFSLTDWFSGAITVPISFIFDPHVIFDAISNRFVVVALGKNDAQQLTRAYVAVTRSGSAFPVSNWCVYEFDLRTQGQSNQWLDYPSVGVNNNAVIISSNRFFFGGTSSIGTQVAWLEKAGLYSCGTANALATPESGTGVFTMQVAQSYINSNVTYLINSEVSSSGSGNTLRLWRTTSARSPFRATLATRAHIPVATFVTPVDAQEPGTNTLIDTGDLRLLNAVLRAPLALWTAHTTRCRPAGDVSDRTCARFYQIDPSANRVVQWNQFTSPGLYYFYPAAVADGAGNMVMVFNRSGKSEFAGVRYSGRRASDPLGAMQPSAVLRAGRGCYVDLDEFNRDRFGDYSALSFDAGTQTFWTMAEFVLGNTQSCTANSWGTQIGQIARP